MTLWNLSLTNDRPKYGAFNKSRTKKPQMMALQNLFKWNINIYENESYKAKNIKNVIESLKTELHFF